MLRTAEVSWHQTTVSTGLLQSRETTVNRNTKGRGETRQRVPIKQPTEKIRADFWVLACSFAADSLEAEPPGVR